MFKKVLHIILLILWAAPLFAQSVDTAWVRRYNGPGNKDDKACAIEVDSSGNIYVTGESYGIGTGVDYATIKYDCSGNQLWVRRYNGPGDTTDSPRAMVIDDCCNIYVTGQSYGSGTAFDYATVSYDESGYERWVKRYHGSDGGYDQPFAIAVDNTGNVYVTGHISWAYTGGDYLTIKYDSTGNEIWVRRYDSPTHNDDWAHCIAVDDSGNVYVTGSCWFSDTTAYDYVTIKYDDSGNEIWVKRYNAPMSYWDYARAMVLDDFCNVYVTGSSRGSGTYWDYATVKYNSSGDEVWVARYDGLGNWTDDPRAVTVDNSANVYVTGGSHGSGTAYDYVTIKYDQAGNELWVARYNGPGNYGDRAWAIAVDDSGNVYVTGSSDQNSEYPYNPDCTTIKYDPNGNEVWIKRYNGSGNSSDAGSAMTVDASNNIYVIGFSSGSSTSYDYFILKYVQYLRGDVTNNGEVNIDDEIYLIDYILRSGPEPMPIFWVGDVNCSNIVDIVDVVYLTNYLFKKGPAPCD